MFGRFTFTAQRELRRRSLGDAVGTDLWRRRDASACRSAGCSWMSAPGGTRGRGERVFVVGDEVFPLGHSRRRSTIVPIEISAGWQFRFAHAAEVDSVRGGRLHVVQYTRRPRRFPAERRRRRTVRRLSPAGGAEFKITTLARRGRRSGVDARCRTRSVNGGVSETFNETDLGGTTLPRQDHDRPMTAFERQGADSSCRGSRRAGSRPTATSPAWPASPAQRAPSATSCEQPIVPACPTIASLAPAGGLAATPACRSNGRCSSAEGLTVDPATGGRICASSLAREELRRIRRSKANLIGVQTSLLACAPSNPHPRAPRHSAMAP